jgi:uncharacterized protein (DUF1778 family)
MDERKTEKISFRITPADREYIDKVAAGFGMTISEYIRDFTIRLTKQIYERKKDNNGKKS